MRRYLRWKFPLENNNSNIRRRVIQINNKKKKTQKKYTSSDVRFLHHIAAPLMNMIIVSVLPAVISQCFCVLRYKIQSLVFHTHIRVSGMLVRWHEHANVLIIIPTPIFNEIVQKIRIQSNTLYDNKLYQSNNKHKFYSEMFYFE